MGSAYDRCPGTKMGNVLVREKEVGVALEWSERKGRVSLVLSQVVWHCFQHFLPSHLRLT